MGATVSARWASGDDDAVVIVVLSSSLHRCCECEGEGRPEWSRGWCDDQDDDVVTCECEGRADQAKWASGHDDGVTMVTERSSHRRCHCIAVASARGWRAKARWASGHDDSVTIATA